MSARWLALNTPQHKWNRVKIYFLLEVLGSKTFCQYIPAFTEIFNQCSVLNFLEDKIIEDNFLEDNC